MKLTGILRTLQRSKAANRHIEDYDSTTTRHAKRNSVSVDSIRQKLAGYQQTENRACFTQPQELTYLQNGSIEFESVIRNSGDTTMGFAVPFTSA